MNLPADLNHLSPKQLRTLSVELIAEVDEKNRELHYRQTRIDQLTHEMAVIKRYSFGKRSEQVDSTQASLLDESVDADIAAIEEELAQAIYRKPESSTCGCGCEMKRIGKDVVEKLDYTPGVFTVERHVRGECVCAECETLTQTSVPAHVIDKGIPTAGLLAQVLVDRYTDHLPRYRQEKIFARRPGPAALDLWAMGRRVRGTATSFGRRVARSAAHARRAARRRDSDADARSGREENASRLPVGVLPHLL